MTAIWGMVRGHLVAPAHPGWLARAAAAFKRRQGLLPGQREGGLSPEPEHHPRFSVSELDACIEQAMHRRRSGIPAQPPRRAPATPELPPRQWAAGPEPIPAPPPPIQARAFGGDLYPTAAHAFGRHVRYVRDKTWLAPPARAGGEAGRTGQR